VPPGNAWSLLSFVALVGAFLTYTPSASSSSSNQAIAVPRAVPESFNLILPLTTTFDVDRTDDTAAATACTVAPNDCSLRDAIIAANTNLSADGSCFSLVQSLVELKSRLLPEKSGVKNNL
jgi:hypothetical protein